MNVWDFEEAVWKLERIRIVIRASGFCSVQAYDFTEPDWGHQSAARFLRSRIRPRIGDKEVFIIDGRGGVYDGGNKQLDTIRHSYSHWLVDGASSGPFR